MMSNMERSRRNADCYLLNLTIGSLLILMVNLGVSQAANCEDWTFLCEHPVINVLDFDKMKPIRMPLTSRNCDLPGEAARCRSIIKAKAGQRILVKAGILFEVGEESTTCDVDRHVMFSSASASMVRSDRKCGSLAYNADLFESVGDEMEIEYKSDNELDGAVLWTEAFGCSRESFVAPNRDTSLELTDLDFTYTTVQYEGEVRCREGYLMEGSLDVKTITCKTTDNPGHGKKWSWDVTPNEYVCNRISCPELDPPVNGLFELSNSRYHMSQASFQCAEGYMVRGGNTRVCKVEAGREAYWDGASPVCEVVDCGQPNLDAVYALPSITTYQSKFTYTCVEGMMPRQSQATCSADGTWNYIPCQAVLCSEPKASSSWSRISETSETRWYLGQTLSYSCIHDNSIVTITCESGGTWTVLPACRKPSTPKPIERLNGPSQVNSQTKTVDKGAIVGGAIAGFIFAVIIIIIACVFVRKSAAKRRATRNNNEKEEMKQLRQPLKSGERPAKPKRSFRDQNGTSSPVDSEKATLTTPEPEYAAVVQHFKNRGNNRKLNGTNGTNGTLGTASSRGSTEKTGSSIEMIETGDLYDSVLNGKNFETSSTGGEKQAQIASVENELNETHENSNSKEEPDTKQHTIYVNPDALY